MGYGHGIAFKLDLIDFDAYGRARINDDEASGELHALLRDADAVACRSGCGLPLACDSALIRREELVQTGPSLLINNADFASIIRKRKAVDAREAVIVFEPYRAVAAG
ncbi:hypothetical protein [Maricaulis sp.]|uniref:hypothetical protein n=1 Tax=Maricaulis sp. TaxID=1486257 RepID=UPI0026368B23|nr:hypothetical protein [Maricaulis sp.]